MDEDDELFDESELFDVACQVYLQYNEDPVTVMVSMRAPADRSTYNGEYVVDATEQYLFEQFDSNAMPWASCGSLNGDKTLLFKDHVQAIRILAPELGNAE